MPKSDEPNKLTVGEPRSRCAFKKRECDWVEGAPSPIADPHELAKEQLNKAGHRSISVGHSVLNPSGAKAERQYINKRNNDSKINVHKEDSWRKSKDTQKKSEKKHHQMTKKTKT